MPLSVPTPLSDISGAVWAYISRLVTNPQAAELANLDATISSRETEAAALARATAILAAIGAIPITPELEADALTRYTALGVAIGAIPTTPELEADALARATAILAAIGAIPTTPELDADALKRYTALAAGISLLVATSHFDASEFESEWQTDPVVENVASAVATALTAGSITPTYPTGAVERRVIVLAMIKAASQAANTHHIGFKVQYRLGGAGGYSDLKVFTANPPLTIGPVDGATDSWAYPIDVTAIVSSGVQVEFRFEVDSDNAGSINYTTSFLLALVYRMG